MTMTKEQIKNTGATFTPKELAIFLAEKISSYLKSTDNNVLDPACGEGELLIAMADLLGSKNANFSLTGYDANEQFLDAAERNLQHLQVENKKLHHSDFLEVVDVKNKGEVLSLFDTCTSSVNNSYNIVIANPPYVRTQLLGTEQAQLLAKKFNLKGRVDLYYPFLIAMTESLVEGGILGVITSNRYLSTKSGESIRKFLSENYEILEIIDLGDTKLFDAAVLPAIFIGKKKRSRTPSIAKFTKVYEDLNGYITNAKSVNSIYEVLRDEFSTNHFNLNNKQYKKTEGLLKYTVASGECWEMLSSDEADWVSTIDSSAKYVIADFFKVKVGIKSTADKVFISDKWHELNGSRPEAELLKELLSQEDIEPWNAKENANLKVLYPHTSVNGKKETVDIEKYPKAQVYLLQNEETLKSRKYLIDAGRQWFELWVPHRPDQWKYPKIVFPDISLKPRFCFDEKGKIVNGNCYWIAATEAGDVNKLLLIQGIANSKLMTKYHDLVFNNKLYSGRRRYISQYVEKYPLPDINSTEAVAIITIVKQLNKVVNNKKQILDLEEQLEIKVAESFGVNPVLRLD